MAERAFHGRGPMSEKSLEELRTVWKKSISRRSEELKIMTDKIVELTAILNDCPEMQLIRLDGPGMKVGGFYTGSVIKVLMLYELTELVPIIPDHVRAAFFDLVGKVDRNFPVYETKIGWQGSMDPTVVIDPPDDRGHVAIHHCPMLQIKCTVR